jgi:hypothetical protein
MKAVVLITERRGEGAHSARWSAHSSVEQASGWKSNRPTIQPSSCHSLRPPNKTLRRCHPDARDERKDLCGRTFPPHRSFRLAELALRR